MLRIVESIMNFIYANLFWFQFASLFLSGIMLWIIISINIKVGLTKEKITHWMDVLSHENISRNRSLKAWVQIKKRLKAGGETNLKLAILEADRILDEILKLAHFPGDNLNERLAGMNPSHLSNVEELRQAHKLRNRIVSEPDFSLSPGETEIAMGIYKKSFVELGLIEEDE